MRRALIAGLLVLAVSACSGEENPITPVTPPPPPPPVGATVTIVDNSFTPASVSISAGQRVDWTNSGAAAHNVTATGGGFGSNNLAPGATYSRTFLGEGTFNYRCTLHPGMSGVVVVGPQAIP